MRRRVTSSSSFKHSPLFRVLLCGSAPHFSVASVPFDGTSRSVSDRAGVRVRLSIAAPLQ